MIEQPNTVSGLQKKRAQLAGIRQQLETELRKVVCDLDHLDACIRLFDPATTPEAIKRYATQHRAKVGQLSRFVLEQLRIAAGPVTSRELAAGWLAARDLRADDGTFLIIRRRLGACLVKLVEWVGNGRPALWRVMQ